MPITRGPRREFDPPGPWDPITGEKGKKKKIFISERFATIQRCMQIFSLPPRRGVKFGG